MTIAKAITYKVKLHQKPWVLKRVQDDGRKQRDCSHPFRHPELVSGSMVQKVTDSERSEHSSFEQGEYRAKY
ncbi:hypothetical protein [Pseudoalteromonas sp. Of7M-16]|uniref:hypothetical protein n=1 Tax=Pseudoalteromonas sp. Of7M-16 TaxID=2917756 RepID=UPI001EF63461|nr:hypothetical protein [Pseudoalteromonas sp. Of7M-16]MCG7546727.1 hypothetical protein [Pseudoalteromonas sp. Of7M-16]